MQRKRVVVIAFLLTLTTGCFYRANPLVHKEAEPQVKEELLGAKQDAKPEAPWKSKTEAKRVEPPTVTVPTIPPVVSEPRVSKVTLGAIGDVLIHSEIYQDAKQKDGTYNFFKMFEDVQSYLRVPDILVANQETMIGGKELRLSGYPSFNSPQEVGDALKAAGVDLVTVANNHTLDRGEKVIQSALSYWDRLGIPYTGSFKSKEDQKHIRTMVKNNITFSFLSYAYGRMASPIRKGRRIWLIASIPLRLLKKSNKPSVYLTLSWLLCIGGQNTKLYLMRVKWRWLKSWRTTVFISSSGTTRMFCSRLLGYQASMATRRWFCTH
ncbi:CapA family protein [Paenibacillus sp. CGMCC 1.16610]|nr:MULTISPECIES: CapA family protein [Paenibacillus]MBA2941494.1 CapA family protein [Paenibacillus sp. CGMCC 1.16610]